MKKLVNVLLIAILACPIVSIVVSSCAEETDCSMMGRAHIWCGFYTINENNEVVAYELDSLTVSAFYAQDTLQNRLHDINHVDLPLRYLNDSTIFVFHFTNNQKDTILVKHTNTPYFVSMDCGYEMQQKIVEDPWRTSTSHRIDSIRLTREINTNTNGIENLQIFFNQ